MSVQFEHYYEPWGRWFEVKAYPSRDGGLAVYFRDITERKHGQQMERLLAEASATFASSLDYRETLKGVAGLIVPVLADLCIFDVAGRDGALAARRLVPRRRGRGGGPASGIDRIARSSRRPAAGITPWPASWRPAGPSWSPRSPTPGSGPRPSTASTSNSCGGWGSGPRSSRRSPPATRSSGALTLCHLDRSGRRYDEADRRIAEELARRAGLAVDNAALYQSAQDARTDAEAASRMKDQFLATLSHELRTPLSAIVGWSRLLRSGKLEADDVEQGLDAIDRNARIQTQLIEDLLDLSRIISGDAPAGHPAGEPHRGHRRGAGDDPAGRRGQGRPHRQDLRLAGRPGGGRPGPAPAGRLEPPVQRGEVHAAAGAGSRSCSSGSTRTSRSRVTDTGIGIKPEFLPFVFDRFRQADGTTTRRHGGLGLGLSIVKQLVEMHGGTVRAKSPGEDQGSTFCVALPLLVVHDQEEGRRVRPKEPAAGELDFSDALLDGVSVLVVDDEPDARELIRRVLAGSRAQVARRRLGARGPRT